MTDPVAELYVKLAAPARDLIPARNRFHRFYDDWIADCALPGKPAGFVHAVVSAQARLGAIDPAPRPEDSSDAMRLALAALADEGQAFACFSAAIAAGLFDSTANGTPIARHRKILSTGVHKALSGPGAHAVLQAVATNEILTDDNDFWTDLGNLLPAITLARRRLCRVISRDQRNKKRNGTGFLIGPSTILTNLHVAEGIATPLTRPKDLRVQFDYSETTGLKRAESSSYNVLPDWCIAKGSLGDDSHKGPSDDFWWDNVDTRDTWLEHVETTLDYALIRIDGTPGLQRGWYDLSVDRAQDAVGVWVMHHPAQQGHTITRGPIPIGLDDDPHRIFHTASTAKGSSGGLVLDQDGVPLGLHYLGLESGSSPDPDADDQVNQRINVAIALPHIARAIDDPPGTLASLAETGQIRPFRGCLDGRRPVFGRTRFLDDLQALWTGDRHIMRINVPDRDPPLRKPGKSFSAKIVAGIFSGPEHHHILFRAGDIKVDALRVAQDALRTFAEDLVPDLPSAADTTSPAYIRRLVGFFGRALRERLRNHTVWIVLDDLDRHDLSDASGREFLATLYNQIDQMPNLRILLIGLPEDISISGMQDGDVIASPIGAEDLEKLRERLIDWLKERGGRDVAITDVGYALIARMLTSFAGTDAPLEQLSDFVTNHVAAAADEVFGTALQQGQDSP
jgi:trypsin-like peptidase